MIRLTNGQWERIRNHFPEEHMPDGRPGRKPIPTRRVFEAVLWILNTGAQWHMLPQSYPNYKSVAKGGGFSISMLYYLKSHGVDSESVKQIQSTGASLPGLLDNHRVDAILSQSPYNLKVQGPKYRDLGSPLIAMSDRLQTTLYVAKQSWAADNRE